MKRPWLLLTAVLSLLALFRVPASAVQLDTSWYAKVTYVTFTGGSWQDVWFTPAFGSTHLAGTRLAYVDGTTLVYGTLFTVSTGGGAALGESAYAQEVLWPPYTLGNLSFHYETYWTSPALELRVYGVYLGPRGDGPRLLWSSGAVGGASGDVFINENPNGYRFEFVVVPEPSAAAVLAFGVAALLVRRRSYPEGAA